MSGEHELPTASVVRSSQATPARRRGQLCTDVRPAGLHLSKPVRCSDNRSHLFEKGIAHYEEQVRKNKERALRRLAKELGQQLVPAEQSA